MTAWAEHINACRQCSDWIDARAVRKRGYDPGDYPCVHLAKFATMTCEHHVDRLECPDILIYYNPRHDDYSLPIRDGGLATLPIYYCPWCGAQIPESKRDRWFDELAALGFDDPYDQEIPECFKTNAWWKAVP